MEPGSSTGGKEAERGRPGRGLYIEGDLGYSIAHGAGERSRSLKTACRLAAALVRAKLYEADRGLKQNCLFSVVTILRSDGRLRPDFGVTYSWVLANGVLPQRMCMRLYARRPAHAVDNAHVFASFCATTSTRSASAS
jgi:hypothetical protein